MTRSFSIALLPVILSAQQAAAPDEIRVSSRPYVVASPYSIRVETKLVELNVAVRDGNGRAVRGLKRESFQLFDEGKEREIAAFSEEVIAGSATVAGSEPAGAPAAAPAAAPPKAAEPAVQMRFVALVIDDVNAKDYAAAGDLKRTQTAAAKFLVEALRPGTKIGIFTISGKTTQDFTDDRAKLTAAIAALKPHQRLSEIGLQHCPRVTPYRAYQIAHLNDRETVRMIVQETAPAPLGYNCVADPQQVIIQAEDTWRRMREIALDTLASIDGVVDHVGKMAGARVLVMASSGFFGETLEQQQQAIIDHAIRSGVVINALDSKGIYSEAPPGQRPTDPDPGYGQPISRQWEIMETKSVSDRVNAVNTGMADLAHGTGGEFIHNSNDLHSGFLRVGAPPEVTYRMSFNPNGVAADGSYHKLTVKLAHAGNYQVSARPGYFAPTGNAAAGDPKTKLDREVAGSSTLADVPADLSIQVAPPSGDQRSVSIAIRIDVAKLQFAEQDGRRKQLIAFVSALLDERGNVVAAKEGFMDLALKPETYQRLTETGLNAVLSFRVPAGLYKLREVVQEELHSSLSSFNRSIDLQ